jgi:hypothetical protein
MAEAVVLLVWRSSHPRQIESDVSGFRPIRCPCGVLIERFLVPIWVFGEEGVHEGVSGPHG